MPAQHVDGVNAAVLAPNAVTAATVDPGYLKRLSMNRWALWAIKNHGSFTYTEGPGRSRMVNTPPGTLPQSCDCSGFVTGLAKWAGATDPNGLRYNPVGYTGTLLDHCNHITKSQARMGDLICYGPGTGTHVVLILEKLTADFYVASHGHQGNPARYLSSQFLHYFGQNSARYLRWLS